MSVGQSEDPTGAQAVKNISTANILINTRLDLGIWIYSEPLRLRSAALDRGMVLVVADARDKIH